MATQREIAKHLDVGERYVRELIERGVIAKAPPGKYDIDESRVGYIRHLRSVAAGHKSEDGRLDLAEQRARLASAQADKTEMENAERRGELISAADYRAGAILIAAGIGQRVSALGAKLQHDLAATSSASECKRIVDDATREALEDLAAIEVVAVDDGGAD